ncbi:MAG TPA: RIP metalloprotease RseP [Steroidobacteraceae bacterium]|nr:RIP metalloprotease RseP [Steroidobacteraceae bacterium]
MRIMIFLGAFLLAIGILVAVHEFGHYWVAKRLKFKVLRFSIGFGKPLLKRIGRAPDRTEYCLSAIPLGGYVKLLDEREGEVAPAELSRSFTRRPIAQRIAVLLAGPAMNLLFAALLYAILAMHGAQVIKPVVGDVRPGSPAALAGLRPQDQILRVGDERTRDTEDLQIALLRYFSGDGVVPLWVRRDGVLQQLTVRVLHDRLALTAPGKLLPGLGFDLASWHAAALVQAVPPGSAGARAGLQPGDRLLAVDGRALANSSQFVAAVNAAPRRQIAIDVERRGARVQLTAAVPAVLDQGRQVGRLGITIADGPRSWPAGLVETERSSPLAAVGVGVAKTWEMSSLTVQMLWRMITGKVSAKNISGPISIAEFAGISAYLGIGAFLSFLAVISVSLGVLNLAPVPLLDGGQVVYQLIEGIKGSPLSERVQIFGQQVGIALLVLLMSLAFYNDISRHLN